MQLFDVFISLQLPVGHSDAVRASRQTPDRARRDVIAAIIARKSLDVVNNLFARRTSPPVGRVFHHALNF